MATKTGSYRFQGFISYSHAGDERLATALQHGLHSFARPWFARRSCRVFRDSTTLSLTAELWPSIERALLDAEYLILLASPESAGSAWVAKEVTRWCEARSPRNLLIVMTGGNIRWDAEARDFDWEQTTALPRALAGKLEQEPLYLDLRWARTEEHLSLRHPGFLEAVADISCTLRGMEKDELLGREVREHLRRRRITRATIAVLALLTTAAVAASVWATSSLRLAERRRVLAEERRVQARGVAEKIVFELHESLRGVPEATGARKILGEQARGLLTALGPAEADFRQKRALMVLHTQRADELSGDDPSRARDELIAALALARELAAQDAMSAAFRRDVSVCLNKLAQASIALADFDAAQGNLEEDLALTRELLARAPGSLRYRHDMALTLEKLGVLCRSRGDVDCARRLLAEDLAVMRELHAEYPTDRGITRGLAVALIETGELSLRQREPEPARAAFRDALAIYQQLQGRPGADGSLDRDVSVALLKLGDLAPTPAEARSSFEQALELRRGLAARNSGDRAAQRDLAVVLGRAGGACIEGDVPDVGVRYLEEAQEIYGSLRGAAEADPEMTRDLAVTLFDLGQGLIELGRFEDARRQLTRGLELFRTLAVAPGSFARGVDLTAVLRRTGRVELHLGNGAGAARLHREVCARIAELERGALDADTLRSYALDSRDIAAAHTESRSGDKQLARECARVGIDHLVWLRGHDPALATDVNLESLLGELRALAGEHKGAIRRP